MKSHLYIGTSGYTYAHWRGPFYPSELKEREWFRFYCTHFNSVELNVTFYRLPNRKAFETWRKTSPDEFGFVIKGSRYITHIKKLKESRESLRILFENASGLGEKLLCVLWQLPPAMKCNLERLKEFVTNLNNASVKCRHTFEFRNPSWFCEEVYSILRENGMSLCIADSPSFPQERVLTSDFVYLRLHGGKVLYGSEYSQGELEDWARNAREWMKGRQTLFAFFDNDAEGFAIKNAMSLREILEKGKRDQ